MRVLSCAHTMARKSGKQKAESSHPLRGIPAETKRAIIAIFLIILGIIFTLAYFGAAGNGGTDVYWLFNYLLGVGYFLLPLLFFILAWSALREESAGFHPLKLLASAIFIFAGLGFVDALSGRGGLVGAAIAHPAVQFFDIYAALIILGGLSLISLLILLEGRISPAMIASVGRGIIALFKRLFGKKNVDGEPDIKGLPEDDELAPTYASLDDEEDDEPQQNPVARPVAASEGFCTGLTSCIF